MRKVNGYEDAKVITGGLERLPAGGYVCVVLDVKYEEDNGTGYGDKVILSFEISEGEFKGYFKKNYDSQPEEWGRKWKGVIRLTVPKDDGSEGDEKTQNIFKTNIKSFEESNANYHWDWNENGLKGKTVGVMFRDKQYDYNGKQGFFTEAFSLKPASFIREGDFKIPSPKLLTESQKTQNAVKDSDYPF